MINQIFNKIPTIESQNLKESVLATLSISSDSINCVSNEAAPQQMNVNGNIRPLADQGKYTNAHPMLNDPKMFVKNEAQLLSDAIEQHLSALIPSMQIVEKEKKELAGSSRQNPIPIDLNNSINHKVLNAKE